jgi:glycosyltransferase involved in cell wall biosynthesis
VARRILLFVTDLEIGGTPTIVRELAMRLHAPPAVEIEVACLKKWGPVADQIGAAGIEVTAFGMTSPLQLPTAVARLRQLVRERRIDTVFSFLVHANAIAAIAARKLDDVRFLQSIQTTQEQPRWHWRVQAMAQTAAEMVIVPSTAVARIAQQRSGVAKGKLHVVPNAVDPATFVSHDVFDDPARVRVGYLGRLDPVKNIPYWVEGISFGGGGDVRIEGHIFGEGPERARIERAIDAFKVRDRVFMHGAVSDPRIALAQMDVLCLLSGGEGFGLVLIEAMASGVPVIALRAGGVSDIVVDRENGLLINEDVDCSGSMSARVLELRSDTALRRRIIGGGLQTVRETFSWDVVLPRYRALLGLIRLVPSALQGEG